MASTCSDIKPVLLPIQLAALAKSKAVETLHLQHSDPSKLHDLLSPLGRVPTSFMRAGPETAQRTGSAKAAQSFPL